MEPLIIKDEDDDIIQFEGEVIQRVLIIGIESAKDRKVNEVYINKSKALQIIAHLKQCFNI